jgi:hypothetical protein
MRDTEELRDVAYAPESHFVASQQHIAEAGQSIAMLDQPGGCRGILPAPVSGDDPSFEESLHATETQLRR